MGSSIRRTERDFCSISSVILTLSTALATGHMTVYLIGGYSHYAFMMILCIPLMSIAAAFTTVVPFKQSFQM